jgi:hypothetical protein
MGDGIKSKSNLDPPVRALEGRKKELDSLSKGGVKGGPLGVLGYVPDPRSSFQKPSALGGGRVLSTSVSSVNCPRGKRFGVSSSSESYQRSETCRVGNSSTVPSCRVRRDVVVRRHEYRSRSIEISAKQVEGVVTGYYYNKRNE